MKRFFLLLVLTTGLCVGYVWLQVRIVSLSYQLRALLEKKDSALCTQQYLIAKLLSLTSPDKVEERLLARQVCLSYSPPQRVVRVNSQSHYGTRDSIKFSGLFGMPQAAADE